MIGESKPVEKPGDLYVLLTHLKNFLESILDSERAISELHPRIIPSVQKLLYKAQSGYRSIDQECFIVRRSIEATQPDTMKREETYKNALQQHSVSLTLLNTSRLNRNTIDIHRVEHLLAFIFALCDPHNGIQQYTSSSS